MMKPTEWMPSNPMAVIRQQEFDAYRRESEGSVYARWQASTYELRRDPDMIAYYLFEPGQTRQGRLVNLAERTQGTLDGVLGWTGRVDSAPEVGVDRWGGRSALRFVANERDVIRINQDDARAVDNLERFTVMAWIKPRDIKRVSHHLLTKRGAGTDAINFALIWEGLPGYDNPRSILFNVAQDTSSIQYPAHQTPRHVLRDDGGWTCVAVTFDTG